MLRIFRKNIFIIILDNQYSKNAYWLNDREDTVRSININKIRIIVFPCFDDFDSNY